jgi:hypothetical protein
VRDRIATNNAHPTRSTSQLLTARYSTAAGKAFAPDVPSCVSATAIATSTVPMPAGVKPSEAAPMAAAYTSGSCPSGSCAETACRAAHRHSPSNTQLSVASDVARAT